MRTQTGVGALLLAAASCEPTTQTTFVIASEIPYRSGSSISVQLAATAEVERAERPDSMQAAFRLAPREHSQSLRIRALSSMASIPR